MSNDCTIDYSTLDMDSYGYQLWLVSIFDKLVNQMNLIIDTNYDKILYNLEVSGTVPLSFINMWLVWL